MISKEKWAEIKLSWQRYGSEYIGIMLIIALIVSLFWFFTIRPIMNYFHENEINSLKTEILRKIEDNSATLEFSNENEAKKAKENLKEISTNDNIEFELIEILKNHDKFEIKVQFKSAK
ncbi:hypothetical protein HG452_002985 [Candidatus Saccharibacteria bacterium]|nr:hypothetical protein [Candidatus Saccharibacteria bacterium]